MTITMSMSSCLFIFSYANLVDLAWLSSAILETCLQALRLATFSALPVPMLRQVHLQGQKWRFCVGGGAKTAT